MLEADSKTWVFNYVFESPSCENKGHLVSHALDDDPRDSLVSRNISVATITSIGQIIHKCQVLVNVLISITSWMFTPMRCVTVPALIVRPNVGSRTSVKISAPATSAAVAVLAVRGTENLKTVIDPVLTCRLLHSQCRNRFASLRGSDTSLSNFHYFSCSPNSPFDRPLDCVLCECASRNRQLPVLGTPLRFSTTNALSSVVLRSVGDPALSAHLHGGAFSAYRDGCVKRANCSWSLSFLVYFDVFSYLGSAND